MVSSAHPRIVDGKPSKNPRYLQDRPDLSAPEESYIAMRSVRLYRGLPVDAPIHQPVSAILSGRRNNPPDKQVGIRSLAVYNPIHYQELPELFMDYVCSLTGKSPSTTGAGSEGALTKGPFNAILPIHDLNAALVSMILTQLGGFSTAAGFVGSRLRSDTTLASWFPNCGVDLRPLKGIRLPDSRGNARESEDYDFKGGRFWPVVWVTALPFVSYAASLAVCLTIRTRSLINRILCPETQDQKVSPTASITLSSHSREWPSLL